MPASTLDRASSVPLYRQIEAILREELAELRGQGEGRLTESELIARFSVSRHTVRQALARLSSAGLVDRFQRRGTYAAWRPPIEQPLAGVYTFVRSMRELGLPFSSTVLSLRRLAADEGLRDRLQATSVVEVQRLHYLDGEPLIHERAWLDGARVPGLEQQDVGGGLYDLLQQRYGIRVTSACESIRPVVLDAAEARLLKVAKGWPAFFVERLAGDASGPIELRRSLIRGDRYLYSIQLRSVSDGDLPL